MSAVSQKASGYCADIMRLPVPDLAAAIPFSETVFGFQLASRVESPVPTAGLTRDSVTIGLTQHGVDPTQDGCAFHVKELRPLLAEFNESCAERPRNLREDGGRLNRT